MTTGRIDETEQNQWPQVTLEHLLYGLLLLLAATMRFFALGVQPLTSVEATNSWLAWLAAQGQMAPTGPAAMLADMSAPSSPLLYALHSVLFWIGADSDVAARAIPALFGMALVLLPWFLRPYFGRTWALIVALLLAVDPWLVAYSRLADGLILSLFFGMLTLIGIIRATSRADMQENAADNIDPRWLYAAAVSAGLLLVSGVGAWNFLPVLLLGWLLLGRSRFPAHQLDESVSTQSHDLPNEDLPDEVDNLAAKAPDTAEILAAGTEPPVATSIKNGNTRVQMAPGNASHSPAVVLLMFAAAAILGATGWLSQPAGLGYVSTSLSDWITQHFGTPAHLYPLSWVGLRMLVDQPLLLLFGLLGFLVLWAGRSQRADGLARWPIFIAAWLAWGLLGAVSSGRGPLMLPMLGLPLLLAAAHLGDWLLRQFALSRGRSLQDVNGGWREASFMVVVLVILTIASLFWLLAFVNNQQLDITIAWIVMLILGIGAALFIGFTFWTNRQQSVAVLGLYVGLLLLGATVSSSWQLSQTVDPLQPDGFFAEIGDADVRNLVEDIGMISAQRVGDLTEIPLNVQMRSAPDPLLAWYLRKMRRLTWTVSPSAVSAADASLTAGTNGGRMPLLVTFADSAPTAQVAEGYSGSQYQLRTSWLPSSLLQNNVEVPEGQSWRDSLTQAWSTKYRPLLRWMLFRKITQPPPAERVVLWVAGY